MSTNRSLGRSTSTQQKVRSAYKPKKDRSPNLCAFTFADGRQCRMPRRSGHLHLCYFHAQKEAESLAAQQAGEDISRFLPTKLLTACDLGVALSRTFCAVARGQIKPKVASTLAYLAQTMLQTIPIAQHEYIESFNTNTWHTAVRASFRFDDPPKIPAPTSAPPVEAGRNSSRPGREPGSSSSSASSSTPAVAPPTSPVCHPACPDPVGERSEGSQPIPATQPSSVANAVCPKESASSSNSSLPQSPQPSPKPHTPLPSTITEFAQQLLAGRNSSRSETLTRDQLGKPDSSVSLPSSASSASSAPSSSDFAPACTSSTQPAPSSPCTPPTPNNSQTAPAPPVPPTLVPQPTGTS